MLVHQKKCSLITAQKKKKRNSFRHKDFNVDFIEQQQKYFLFFNLMNCNQKMYP